MSTNGSSAAHAGGEPGRQLGGCERSVAGHRRRPRRQLPAERGRRQQSPAPDRAPRSPAAPASRRNSRRMPNPRRLRDCRVRRTPARSWRRRPPRRCRSALPRCGPSRSPRPPAGGPRSSVPKRRRRPPSPAVPAGRRHHSDACRIARPRVRSPPRRPASSSSPSVRRSSTSASTASGLQHAVDHHRAGAADAGPGAGPAGRDPQVLRRQRRRAVVDDLAHAGEQVLARLGQRARRSRSPTG